MRDYHRLAERATAGSCDAKIALLDLERAIDEAGLTPKQAEVLYWVYVQDTRQEDAARLMGVTQATVSELADVALRKVAAVYARWRENDKTKGAVD